MRRLFPICQKALLLAFLILPIVATAQLYPDLEGQALLDEIATEFTPAYTLSYSDARDTMYALLFNQNDSVTCVYSGHTLYLPPGVDPSIALYQNGMASGINAEHTWPQSFGAGDGNPKSDMHHLFPVRNAVNSARENFPFDDIPDVEATSWYFQDTILTESPSNDIDLYSERKNGYFETREDHKGNVARAMFYFYTIYRQEAVSVAPEFFESQRETLCQWHYLDPVDSVEFLRSNRIAEYQDGKSNPFVLDCTVASRSYCADWTADCPVFYTADENIFSEKKEMVLFPNPVVRYLHILAPYPTGQLTVVDFVGRTMLRQKWEEEQAVDLHFLPKGSYLVFLENENEVLVEKIVKLNQ